MEPSHRVRAYFSSGRIGRANRRFMVEKMGARLGMRPSQVVREYGWPDIPAPASIVYLIAGSDVPADGEPIRIGTSTDVVRRLENLQQGSAHRLQLVAYFPGGPADETELHQTIERHRIKGDWFRMCEDVRREFGARIEAAARSEAA